MNDKIYDTLIIGGGPAGYTAALYCARAGLKTIVLEKFSAGGQMTQTAQIDNYPGFNEGIDGFTLGYKMQQGAERFGADTVRAEVLSADLSVSPKTVNTDSGDYRSKTVIIATGAEHKRLGLEKEPELTGHGVSYCAACDGMLFRGKTVCVIGGGNSAVSDALLLSRVCEKVYLIHRRDSLRAVKVYSDPLLRAENVEFKWNSTAEELISDTKLSGVKVKNLITGESETILCSGLFISIGREPASRLFAGQLDLNENGYIIADETTKTNIPGVFAIGDVRTKPVRQIVTAVSDGAASAFFAEEYINAEL